MEVRRKKNEVSSPTPDFYAFKYLCAVIAKEKRDVASIALPGFSCKLIKTKSCYSS